MEYFFSAQDRYHSIDQTHHPIIGYYLVINFNRPNLIIEFDHHQHHFQEPTLQPSQIPCCLFIHFIIHFAACRYFIITLQLIPINYSAELHLSIIVLLHFRFIISFLFIICSFYSFFYFRLLFSFSYSFATLFMIVFMKRIECFKSMVQEFWDQRQRMCLYSLCF